jgi:hypothetical protein
MSKDHKAHRSKVKTGYYTRQFSVTAANKARRQGRRQRRRVLTLRRNMLAKLPTRNDHQKNNTLTAHGTDSSN